MAEYSPAILLCASPFQPIIDGAAKALVGDRHHGDAARPLGVEAAKIAEKMRRRLRRIAGRRQVQHGRGVGDVVLATWVADRARPLA